MDDDGRLMNQWENHSHKNYNQQIQDECQHHFVASLCYTRSTASMSFNTSVETALPKATFFPSLTEGSFNFESLQCHFGFLSSNQISKLANRNVYVYV